MVSKNRRRAYTSAAILITWFHRRSIGESVPGLCEDCIHARRIESDRGSVFFLCQLALTDSRFKKYPRLPVLSCRIRSEKTDAKCLMTDDCLQDDPAKLLPSQDSNNCGPPCGRRSVFPCSNFLLLSSYCSGSDRGHGGVYRRRMPPELRFRAPVVDAAKAAQVRSANRGSGGRMFLGNPGCLPARKRRNQRDLGIFGWRGQDGGI